MRIGPGCGGASDLCVGQDLADGCGGDVVEALVFGEGAVEVRDVRFVPDFPEPVGNGGGGSGREGG